MKASTWLTAFCISLAAVASASAEDTQRVGELGRPAKLDIQGAKTFSADEICDELFNDFDIVAACDKDAPLTALTTTLMDKTIAGYKGAGFVDAKVKVAVTGGKIVATIEEGDRYLAGEIVVVGNKEIDAALLKNALTPPPASGKRAAWKTGEPASFADEYHAWLHSRIADFLGDHGFYRAAVKVTIEPVRQTKQAILKVEIADEGPRTTLNDIELVGNERHSHDAVFSYLDLAPELALTGERREQIVKRLNQSGRFTNQQWDLGQAANRDDRWQPRLKLTEYDQAPLLGEELSREEAALLKLAEWVERFDESDDELLIEIPKANVTIAFAPRHGYIVTQNASGPSDASGDAGLLYAAVMAEERIGLYSFAQRKKIDAAPPPAPVMGQAEIMLVSRDDGRGRMTAGAGLRSGKSKLSRRHMTMKLKLSASAALSVVRQHEAKATWEGEVVSFEWKQRKIRFDSVTGSLIEQAVTADGPEKDDADAFPELSIHQVRGEFERRLAVIERASAEWPNVADRQRPLSCVGEFVCDELQRFDAESADGYSALGKLLSCGLLQRFDQLLSQTGAPDTDAFYLPKQYFHFMSIEELWSQLPVIARGYGVQLGNHLFPRDGWTSSVWRQGVYLLADRRKEAADELSCQPMEDRGAVCALLSAEILRATGGGAFSTLCARRGLRRLSPAAFQTDCRDLLSGEGLVSQYLLRVADALRHLDADETKALTRLLTRFDLLDAGQSAVLEGIVAALRTSGDDSPAQAAGRALDALWDAGVSDWVEQRLGTLAEPPAIVEPSFADLPEAAPESLVDRYGRPLPDNFGEPSFGLPPSLPLPPRVPGADPAYPTAEAPLFNDENDSNAPLDGAKSVAQEVRELKWLAQAMTERLKKLEDRLHDAAITTDAASSDSAPIIDDPNGKRPCSQIIFAGPEGMVVNWDVTGPGNFDSEPLTVPGRYIFPRGAIYRLKLSKIPGHAGVEVYPIIEVGPSVPRAKEYLDSNAIPILFTNEDFDEVLAGRFVTKVMYLPDEKLENYGPGVEMLVSTRLETRFDPIVEADRRGEILAIVRLGTCQAPYGLGLDGFCPVTLFEKKQWQPGKERFSAIHQGTLYLFIDDATKAMFLRDPDRYCPGLNGNDVVLAVDKGKTVVGTRAHGAFYNDRIYLFASEESLQRFNNAPDDYAKQAESLLVARRAREADRSKNGTQDTPK